MITIETGCTKTMSCHIDNVKSIAYDGCDYALLAHNRIGIIRLNEELCTIGSIRVMHNYSNICYDHQGCSYYACTQGIPQILYRLNTNFDEIDSVQLPDQQGENVKDMSMHPNKPIVLLLYDTCIKWYDIQCETVLNTVNFHAHQQAYAILSLGDGYIVACQQENRTYLELCCDTCAHITRYDIAQSNEVLAMFLTDVTCHACGEGTVYEVVILLMDRTNNEQSMVTLYICCTPDEPTPTPTPVPCKLTCEGGKNEVIHSIALEEAGIAHILNAEGEKLQKAVASNTTIEELLMVNESVRKTIAQITILEGQLCSKLESLNCICMDDICEECNKKIDI